MKIYSVFDEEFKAYGRVVEGIDLSELDEKMNEVKMVESGIDYKRSFKSFEETKVFERIKNEVMGGMPTELGMCWGYNTKLNALEYHRDSEFNYATSDFILLLAKRSDIGKDGMIDSSCVKAFRCPKKVFIEVYATTLHWAPVQVDINEPYRMLCVLPLGTNGDRPDVPYVNENEYLVGCNKWVLFHAESNEAKQGLKVGITGENIDLINDIK